jgi:hypothetical protein
LLVGWSVSFAPIAAVPAIMRPYADFDHTPLSLHLRQRQAGEIITGAAPAVLARVSALGF